MTSTPEDMPATLIYGLAGEMMTGVAFVQDYVEFHFDERVLRVFTLPSVVVGGETFYFPEPGSRDALCSLISKVVQRVHAIDDDRIDVTFSEGSFLHIPLATSERIPEAAHFVPGLDRPIEVW